MRNRPEWLIAFVAIMECGGVAVPLNSWGKAAELQQGLEDSAAQLVICDEARFGFIRETGLSVTTLLVDAQAGLPTTTGRSPSARICSTRRFGGARRPRHPAIHLRHSRTAQRRSVHSC